jgi:hypothetical protein
MAALQSPDLRRLIQMTGETNSIDSSRGKFSWIANVGGRSRLRMFRSRPVARFANLPIPALLRIGSIDQMMRSLRERFADIFMTHPARFGPHIGGGRRSILRSRRRY